MKIRLILLLIVVFILGYIAGNISPLPFFQFFGNIKGENELRVKILSEGKPVKNLEVDVAKKPGPPPKGGVAITNENGIATFYLESGKYHVFFNAANFLKNLEYPAPKQIVVEEGKVNEYTINLTPK
jgi:uncharacterized GH25 family protein